MRLAREELWMAFAELWSAVYPRDDELCWQKGCQSVLVASMGVVWVGWVKLHV